MSTNAGSGTSPAAPQGGSNPIGALPAGALTKAMLVNLVAQGVPGPLPKDDTTPPPAADAGPEAPPENPVQAEDTGQESTPEQPPTPENQDEGTTETDLSQTTDAGDGGELNGLLSGLDETQQAQLAEMLKSVKEGKASWNDIKAGHKAKKTYDQQLAELQTQIEQLKEAKEAPAAATAATNFSEPVAKLKTVDEVEQRQTLAEQSIRAIEDFLEENPEGGAANGQEYTRQQLIGMKRTWQDELRQLPKRATQIVQQAQFAQARQQAQAATVKDYPQLNDAENPDTKLARQLLKDPRFAGEVNADYVALAMATGHRVLQEQKARRTSPAATKPVGKVQPSKPHSAATTAGRSAAVSPKDLIAKVRETGSRSAFAAVLANTKVG